MLRTPKKQNKHRTNARQIMSKNTNVNSVNENDITLAQLKVELMERWELPYSVFVMGPAGVGKSSVFKQMVAEIATGNPQAEWRYLNGCQVVGGIQGEGEKKELKTSYGFIDLRLSQMEPQDLAGIPMPEAGVTKRFLPAELPVVTAEHLPETGLLFLDEANQADITVQKAMFSLILDRKVADVPLKPGWRVMAAGNRLEDSIAVSEMPAPLQNRFAHYSVRPDFACWKDWALTTKLHPTVFSFLQDNMQYFCKSQGSDAEYAFPTPRTWEQVGKTVDYWENKKIEKSHVEKVRSLTALIGRAAAEMYVSFLELSQKINIEEMLSGKIKRKYKPTEIAEAWQCVAALYSYILRTNTPEAVKRVLVFLAKSGTFAELAEFMGMFQHDLNIYDRKLVLDAFTLMSDEETSTYYSWMETFVKRGHLIHS